MVLDPLPSPRQLGFPAKFTKWRPFQEEAIRAIDDASRPVTALVLPTGAGKSVIYIAWALWRRKRVMILTSNRALQTQISTDFRAVGLLDIRGQVNYDCVVTAGKVDNAPCHGGYDCLFKKQGCEYFDKLRSMTRARIVISNYAFWLAYKGDMGNFDLVVMDEAHASVEELARHVGVSFAREVADKYFSRHPFSDWRLWAKYEESVLRSKRGDAQRVTPKTDEVWREITVINRLWEKVEGLVKADSHAFVYRRSPKSWHWDCVWPSQAKGLLFRRSRRFLLTSATMTRKTLATLGFRKEEYHYREFPSSFPLANRPVYYFSENVAPAMVVDSKEADHRAWLRLIDKVVGSRPGLRGVIHAGSYARAEYILANSKHSARMVTHVRATELPEALKHYRATPGAVLVSPSVISGVDFPGDQCEWQIIAKIPFSNPTDPVNIERKKTDPLYGLYLTMLDIVQACGRGVRSASDVCETFIVDGSFAKWFWRAAREFAPAWFAVAVRMVEIVPPLLGIKNKSAKIVD